jgi:riboflavin kinase / FMN adenylyltransferase
VKVYRDAAEVPRGVAHAVTIGAFDGVHLGHRAVLRLVRELANARGMRSAVITFDRHPAEVVRPDSVPALLTTLDEKIDLLDATDSIDDCLVIRFDDARSKESAEQFVEQVLVAAMGSRLVVVGSDFQFGYRRRGNVALLQQMGADLGFEVLGLGLVATPDGSDASADALPYSSTQVRRLLLDGDVDEAASVLGRRHSLAGIVEPGDRRGRELGFPTANIAVPEPMCVPGDGVYAGTVTVPGGGVFAAAVSIGRRPTFYEEGGLRLIEAFLLDFPGESADAGDGDLYGARVTVSFHSRLRGQIRFTGHDATEQLIAQMARDVEAVRSTSLW